MTTSGAIDPSLIDGLAAAARSVPGVREAVAVVRQGTRTAVSDAPGASAPEASEAEAETEADGGDKPSSKTHGGPVHIPDGAATTLQEALRQAAELTPEKGTTFLRRDSAPDLQTYPELLAEAERVLAGLRAAGLEPGDAALFQFGDHRGYMTAFWACVLGGFVPTPVAVATTYAAHNEANRKLRGAWNLLGNPVVLTDAATAPALSAVRELWGESTVRILTVESLAAYEPDTDWYATTPDTPVINLLTSGSTGVPKCVQHTNASVAQRSWSVAQGRGYTSDDVSLIWMPLDHVTMVFYNIRDMFLRCSHVNGRIDDFLADPLLWLDWLQEYGATNTWAPNFAFALINEHADEIARRSWNLSHVKEFANGGEPVIAATSHRFLELLAPHGLPADAMAPAWGMSETCSGVTYSTQSRTDRTSGTLVVAPSSFDGDLRFLDGKERGGKDAVAFSTVGGPLPGVTIRIVDPDGQVLPEDRIGELQIRGVTMMRGYHGNAEANQASFDAEGWFRTGDLAFVHDGELVIAGRKKDQIVVRGANYIAHELENVVEEVEGVRVTFSAAAGVREPGEGSDRLVVFFVPVKWDAESLRRTCRDVRTRLGKEVGLAPDLLVPVTEAEFPKTASGKIQRAALVADLRAGRFADRIETESEEDESADTWFTARQWARLDAVAGDGDGDGSEGEGVRVVFAEEDEDEQVARLGLTGDQLVVVGKGDGYVQEGPGRFRVAPGDTEQIRRVFTRVAAQYGAIDSVVYGWPLPGPGDPADPAVRLTEVTTRFTGLVRALEGDEFGRPLLLLLTEGAVHVRPGDHVDLGVCALPGLVRTAVSELPHLTVRQLDLPADRAKWASAVQGELADRALAGVVAAREGLRWQPRLRPVPEEEATAGGAPFVPGGLYLVTGGLGGIAHDLAGYLLAAYGVRLLLVGRSPAEGDRAEALADLAALGQVTYERTDVADPVRLGAAVAAAEERYGRALDGVLHLAAADVSDQWANLERHTLARESEAAFTRQYAAKVAGTLAIAELLENRPGASLTLFGSVNGEFGGHSFGAYAAANTFLVGFADHWRHERGRDVRCLGWSVWENTGMNRGQSSAAARRRGFRSIDPDDGLRAFLTASGLPHHYLLIGLDLDNPVILAELATDELNAREVLVAYTADGTDPDTVRAALEPVLSELSVPVRLLEVAAIPTDAAGGVDTTQLLLDATPQPTGSTREFEEPVGDLERQIADIWAEVLGRPTVSRGDSFFDLGGNSLRATRLLARIGDELTVRLTTHELYENPTVAGMAAAISSG
ncbi:SDR family NAD(P)-dependent oxidoreductase [Streptomyces spongiae]|uniref:SDR family NAD(P)-dependent oxidoreductase n=1 Tax=Streptomyces spongiae TaxID=565072 RepID=A0A5N8XR98_9ACTN|nr:SDR family NAD(P)-dependent oxidoreductase [Streptomyces spongiae]MPY61942.1 SDR family NAD(P)-dependent oxidoreductase [Streptomyces spongiae]